MRKKCRYLTTEEALRDGDETTGYMMGVRRVMSNAGQWANWRFKYYLMMCSFEDTHIVGITGDNKIQRERLTRRELEMMVMVVSKDLDTTEWDTLYHIMSYFDKDLFESMMTIMKTVLKQLD